MEDVLKWALKDGGKLFPMAAVEWSFRKSNPLQFVLGVTLMELIESMEISIPLPSTIDSSSSDPPLHYMAINLRQEF